jgi:RimJ/RimL family protein N-acetyltransferase
MVIGFDNEKILTLRIARLNDRDNIIRIINKVAGERKYLQTDCYCPTPLWEQALQGGLQIEKGILLLLLEEAGKPVGFARVFPDCDDLDSRSVGNVGVSLLPGYRSRGIGAIMLKKLLSYGLYLGFNSLTANILASNLRSLHFFRKSGFRPIDSRLIELSFRSGRSEEIKLKKNLFVREG